MAVFSSRVVTTLQTYPTALKAWQRVQLHVKATLAGVQVAVAGCKHKSTWHSNQDSGRFQICFGGIFSLDTFSFTLVRKYTYILHGSKQRGNGYRIQWKSWQNNININLARHVVCVIVCGTRVWQGRRHGVGRVGRAKRADWHQRHTCYSMSLPLTSVWQIYSCRKINVPLHLVQIAMIQLIAWGSGQFYRPQLSNLWRFLASTTQ